MIHLKNALLILYTAVKIILAVSFLLMVLNVILFYGFVPVTIHSTHDHTNPFGLSIPLMWAIHLGVGFVAGMCFSQKRFLLTGLMGLLCAALITGVSLLYFGWREDVSIVEILIPLISGILPAVKLYGYLNRKFPLKPLQEEPVK